MTQNVTITGYVDCSFFEEFEKNIVMTQNVTEKKRVKVSKVEVVCSARRMVGYWLTVIFHSSLDELKLIRACSLEI